MPNHATARYFDALADLAGLARDSATAADQLRRTSDRIAIGIASAGLYKLWVPRDFGGGELDLPTSVSIFEEASAIDGSFGWAVTIGTGGGLFAAFLEPGAAHEIFGPDDALIAGSGKPSGIADMVEGGYRASGRWRYASGAHNATTFTANCFIRDRGQPVMDADGLPLIRAMSFPASCVEIQETWDTIGMRGTGSHDFSVEEVFVPAANTFSVFTDAPTAHGPLYRVPFATCAQVSFAAVAIGIARHALEAFPAEASALRHGNSANLQVIHERFAEAAAQVASARQWFHAQVRECWDTITRGGELLPRQLASVALSCTHATASAVRAVDSLYDLGGMTAMRADSELGRCWRDIHGVSMHVSVRSTGFAAAGAALLEGDGE